MFDVLDREFLISEFECARLATAHIDIQNIYHTVDKSRDTRSVVPAVNQITFQTRALGIPNYWIGNADFEIMTNYRQLKALEKRARDYPSEDIRDPFLDFEDDLDIKDNEVVVAKAHADLSKQSAFVKFLHDKGKTTIAMTGMWFDACYTHSVIGMLNAGFNVVALTDATDCPSRFRNKFNKKMRSQVAVLAQDRQDHLMISSTPEFLNGLRHS